jgi:hypothetical protein
MTLKATCDVAGEPALRASWNETVNYLRFRGSAASQSGTAELPANTTATLGDGTFGDVGYAHAVGYTSRIDTSVEWSIRPTQAGPLGDELKCFYSGFVTVG